MKGNTVALRTSRGQCRFKSVMSTKSIAQNVCFAFSFLAFCSHFSSSSWKETARGGIEGKLIRRLGRVKATPRIYDVPCCTYGQMLFVRKDSSNIYPLFSAVACSSGHCHVQDGVLTPLLICFDLQLTISYMPYTRDTELWFQQPYKKIMLGISSRDHRCLCCVYLTSIASLLC